MELILLFHLYMDFRDQTQAIRLVPLSGSTFSYPVSLLALSVCFILRLFYSSLFGWSETPYIDQAGFNLIGIHLPLGLHVRVTMPN